MDVRVRPARREDCARIMELKQELADHQSMTGPMLTPEDLQRDGFDTEAPYFKCLVAELEDEKGDALVIAYALYYYAYAAFDGKTLFLEDLCVTRKIRGKGIGQKIFQELGKICIRENLAGMKLEVLNTNEVGIRFYEKNHGYNYNVQDHMITYMFKKKNLQELADIEIKNTAL